MIKAKYDNISCLMIDEIWNTIISTSKCRIICIKKAKYDKS